MFIKDKNITDWFIAEYIPKIAEGLVESFFYEDVTSHDDFINLFLILLDDDMVVGNVARMYFDNIAGLNFILSAVCRHLKDNPCMYSEEDEVDVKTLVGLLDGCV